MRIPELEGLTTEQNGLFTPYVVTGKISGGHRTWAGARKHVVLMSVLATCNQRGEDFRQTVENTLLRCATSEK